MHLFVSRWVITGWLRMLQCTAHIHLLRHKHAGLVSHANTTGQLLQRNRCTYPQLYLFEVQLSSSATCLHIPGVRVILPMTPPVCFPPPLPSPHTPRLSSMYQRRSPGTKESHSPFDPTTVLVQKLKESGPVHTLLPLTYLRLWMIIYRWEGSGVLIVLLGQSECQYWWIKSLPKIVPEVWRENEQLLKLDVLQNRETQRFRVSM